MSLQFYMGGSGSGKTYRVSDYLIQKSIEEPESRFFMIVPDQFTMQTQKDMVEMHPNHGIMNIDVLSFGRLSHRIFEEVGADARLVLDDTGKSLILQTIAEKMGDKLQTIGSNLKKNGFISEVKSAISEFMQYGIGETELENVIALSEKRGALFYKLKDLALMYKEFNAYKKDHFLTREDTLDLLCVALEKSELIKQSEIVFDGFTGFTPIQYRVIERLLCLGKRVIVTVTIDGRQDPYKRGGEHKLFALSQKTVQQLLKLAERNSIKQDPDVVLSTDVLPRFLGNPELAHLEKHLFRYETGQNSYQKKPQAIQIGRYLNPKEEVRQTGRMIRRLIREEGLLFRDIAVVTGDLAVYGNYVEEEFPKFLLPFFLDRTNGIVLNPLIECIKSALQIKLKNFTYEAVFHYLRCNMTDLTEDEIDLLENHVLAYGIKGQKKWSSLFTTQKGETTKEMECINKTREKVMESLAPVLGKTTLVSDAIQMLYSFLTGLHAEEKLYALSERFKEEGRLAKAKEYEQIYRLVMDLFDQIMTLMGENPMDLQEFYDVLNAGFGEIQVGTIPQNVDRIVVGDIERTRLNHVKVLFFIGVNDGNIPKSGAKGGLISDIDREFLAQCEVELSPTPRQQMYIQRLYLYMNMTKPSKALFLSFAQVDADGKAMRPAYLIETMEKLYPELAITQAEGSIETWADGLETFAEKIRDYIDFGNEEIAEKDQLHALYFALSEHEKARGKLEQMEHAIFYEYDQKILGSELSKKLYGEDLTCSVSRLERFANCAYSHFLQYGMHLKERELYSFEDVDMGTVFHGVLQDVAEKLREKGTSFLDAANEMSEKLVEKSVDEYALLYGGTVLLDSARNRYAIDRMKRILKRTVSSLQYQLQKGHFVPTYYEMKFFEKIEDMPNENTVNLQGRIDRIDLCKQDDTLLVKVIDYKSGSRTLELPAIYYGLQLQLLVYMNAALGIVEKNNPDQKIEPAAVLYYHIADPVIEMEGMKEEAEEDTFIDSARKKELCMTGFVNEAEYAVSNLDASFETKSDVIPVERKRDGSFSNRSSTLTEDELKELETFVSNKTRKLAKEILAGKIDIHPCEYESQDACNYCSYRSVCGFDISIPGYEKEVYKKLSQEEVFAKIEEEAQEEKE